MSDSRGASRGRVLLTGAAGFIGFHTTKRLLDDGYAVLGIDNLNDYYAPELKRDRLAQIEGRNGFSFERLDVADHAGVLAAFESFAPDAVVHLAAQAGVRYSIENPRAYVSANVDGFLSILEACRHRAVRHLVYASSSSVYGANTKVPFSESDGVDHPVSLYAATKRANELMAHTYAHLFGVPSSGLRFFTVYGPWGRPDMAYFKFTKAIIEGRAIDVYDEERMSRDFTYIDDIVEAISRLIDHAPGTDPSFDDARPSPAASAAPFRIYNIGNHTPVRLQAFIAAIEAAVGKPAVKRHLPRQPGDVEATYADVAALAQAVDFAPRTPLDDGIARFVRWYRDYYGS